MGEERGLPEHGFSRLLEWLDDGGTDSNGGTYHEIRRLVSYFDRRNRPLPDELADETLERVARTLEKDGAIAVRSPARFCYVTAGSCCWKTCAGASTPTSRSKAGAARRSAPGT